MVVAPVGKTVTPLNTTLWSVPEWYLGDAARTVTGARLFVYHLVPVQKFGGAKIGVALSSNILGLVGGYKKCVEFTSKDQIQGWTGSPGCLALARWVGGSGVLVGRHVKCWSRPNDLPR